MIKKKIKIHEVLPRLLEKRKLSIRELARSTGVAQTTLNSWTKPNAKPSEISSLKLVADFFGITLDYLLWNEPQKTNVEQLETDVILSGLFKIRLEKVKE